MEIAEAWGTERQEAILRQVYPTLEKVSVDTAVMEPASADQRVSLVTVVADVEWLDVGSWPSYGQTLARDEGGNRLGGAAAAPGATVLEGCRDTLVVSEEAAHTIALLGCEGLIVVHTRDATLIMPAERAEELKKLHSRAPERLK
jgi:mannose-1-phosphate guanylyltransferase